jgi:hypothetical protein
MALPHLSVVIIASDARRHTERCLESMLDQDLIDRMEVIILDGSLPGTPPITGADHAHVRVVRVPHDADYGAMRAQGIDLARSPLVTVFEEHSFAMPGWAAAVVAAHAGPWSAVGGEEYSAVAGEGWTDAAYLEHCIRWMPPAPRGEASALPTHNVTFKRAILLSYRADLPAYLTCLPLLYWKLTEDGHRMYVEPDARYLHTYAANPQTLLNHIHWSRLFGRERASRYRWSIRERIVRCLASPALPWLRLARLGWFIIRERPERTWLFLYMSPAVLLVEVAGVLGETLGLLLGSGRSPGEFSRRHARAIGLA